MRLGKGRKRKILGKSLLANPPPPQKKKTKKNRWIAKKSKKKFQNCTIYSYNLIAPKQCEELSFKRRLRTRKEKI